MPRISTARIPFDELTKDREKVRHRLTLARLAVLDSAEGDSRLRHLTRLMHKLREAPPAQTIRPPQPNRCVDRAFDIVVTEIDSRQSNAILDLDSGSGTRAPFADGSSRRDIYEGKGGAPPLVAPYPVPSAPETQRQF